MLEYLHFYVLIRCCTKSLTWGRTLEPPTPAFPRFRKAPSAVFEHVFVLTLH